MTLCGLYLIVMLMFHSDIQDSRPNPKHRARETLEEEVAPQLKKTLAPLDPGYQRTPTGAVRVIPETRAHFQEGFHDNGMIPLPQVKVRHVQQKTEAPHMRACDGPDNGHQFEFHELIPNKLYLYSAFWDTRPNDFDNTRNGTFVRIMSVLRWAGNKPDLVCTFQTSDGRMLKTDVHYYEMCENHGRPLGGFIISCPVPAEIPGQPCSVSLAKTSTWLKTAGYKMKVLPLKPRDNRDQFAICVPPIYGNVNKRKLVEFIEVSKMLGAQRIVFYDYKIGDETAKVLEYYEASGYVDVLPWMYPELLEKSSWYHGQLIAIQDCLYRNMHTAEYLAFNDIDEFIVPHVHADWTQMAEAMFQPDHCAYQLPSAFFPPPPIASNKSILLTSTKRTKFMSTIRTKCLVKPYLIFEKGIHHVSKPIWAHLQVVRMPKEIAFLHHYRLCMRDFAMNCKEYIDDFSMKNYSKDIKYRIYTAMSQL